jgi:hypothetical protein
VSEQETCRVADLERELAAARDEIARFQQLKLESLQMENRTSFSLDATMRGDMVSIFAAVLGEVFEGAGGVNLVETIVEHPRLGPLVLSISRKCGKTAMELRAQAQADADALRECLEQVTPEAMGGTPDLFHPEGGWDAWEKKAKRALSGHACLEYQERMGRLQAEWSEMRQANVELRTRLSEAAAAGFSCAVEAPPKFKTEGIDITGGVESSEFVRRMRDDDDDVEIHVE